MRILFTVLTMVALAVGCKTNKPDRPDYDRPYPITEMVDPVTGKTPVTR